MTPAHLAEIEGRHAAATEGPWYQKSGNQTYQDGGHMALCAVCADGKGRAIEDLLCFFPNEGEPRVYNFPGDGEFIAHSWQDISDLLALVKEQAAKLAEANAGLDQFAADIVGLREELDAEFARNKEQAGEMEVNDG